MILPATTFAMLTIVGFAHAWAGDSGWRPELVALDESGDRNIPNYRFDSGHTAGGHFQITDTNWRWFAPMLDIDVGKYPNAMSAPEQLQGQVAGKMYAETGYMPWLPYNAQLRRDLTQDDPRAGRGVARIVNSQTKERTVSVDPPTTSGASPLPPEAKTPSWDVFPDIPDDDEQPQPLGPQIAERADAVTAGEPRGEISLQSEWEGSPPSATRNPPTPEENP
jgi:hypothetical protein